MEKYGHIVDYYKALPDFYKEQTIGHLKELESLVYEYVEVPELEGELTIYIKKVLLTFDFILGDELICHDDHNFARLNKLRGRIISYLTTDLGNAYSYGAKLTFEHYLNYVLEVVNTFEDYMKKETNWISN